MIMGRELDWISSVLMGMVTGTTTWDNRIDGKIEALQCTMIEHIMMTFRKKKMSDISSVEPLLQGIERSLCYILLWTGYRGRGEKARGM